MRPKENHFIPQNFNLYVHKFDILNWKIDLDYDSDHIRKKKCTI